MSTYAFEVMSPAQAAGFQPADRLVIGGLIGSPDTVGVAFSGANVTLTSAGRSLTFGAAFTSQVRALRPAGEAQLLLGTPGGDMIVGTGLGDALYGGAGDDTLFGGLGADTLTGGPGADVFDFGDALVSVVTTDIVMDFEAADRFAFEAAPPTAAEYQEVTFSSLGAASTYGIGEINAGRANVVAVQFGPDILLFVDGSNRNIVSDLIRLKNADLTQLDVSNFIQSPSVRPATPTPPPTPDAPPPMTQADTPTPQPVAPAPRILPGSIRGQDGVVTGNMDAVHFSAFQGGTSSEHSDQVFRIAGGGAGLVLGGSGFHYDSAHGQFLDGQVGFVQVAAPGLAFTVNVSGGVYVTQLAHWIETDDAVSAFSTVLALNDSLSGSSGADLIRSYGGNDVVVGGGGGDTIWGGQGDDVIYAQNLPGVAAGAAAATYLRGEEGDDYIVGASGFDDANGNQGNDTISTGDGDDYCVGGRDNDLLFGDGGQDYVYGNLGNDTCEGGDGNDTVRGGQGDDIVRGGAGNDFVSGDKGSDTLTGGTGADIFHTFGDAGVDVVTDFNFAEGDRVQLDPGTTYTAVQSGTSVLITMSGGGQMTLLNTALATLSTGWIFVG